MHFKNINIDGIIPFGLPKDLTANTQLIAIRRNRTLSAMLSVALILLTTSCSDPRSDGLSLGEERSTSNEAKITEEMISTITDISLDRHPQGQIKRFNQSKTLGCFDANFVVNEDLSAKLRQGLFSNSVVYPAVVRFANATKDDDREKDFRGMSISVLNVSGDSLWGVSGRQDFLLNSHPVLFAKDGSDFLEFIKASKEGKLWQYFIRPSHFYSLKVALQGRSKDTNPMAMEYWSTTPFRHGPDQTEAVKYSVKPCTNSSFIETKSDSPNFLSESMSQQLDKSRVCFDFMLQFQTDPQKMPIENASKLWDESESPFQSIAKIYIDQQNFNTPDKMAECENRTFNPWQSIAAHQPLGDINRLRKAVYSEIGKFRTKQNQQRD